MKMRSQKNKLVIAVCAVASPKWLREKASALYIAEDLLLWQEFSLKQKSIILAFPSLHSDAKWQSEIML